MKFKGFTLIELLIVVAIIAILAAIAIPNFLQAQVRAKVSRVQSDMRSIATALESYYVDHNEYIPDYRAVWDGDSRYGRYLQRQIHLTTPIAYMTSIPEDVFAEGPAIERGSILRGPYTVDWDPEGELDSILAFDFTTHRRDPDSDAFNTPTMEVVADGLALGSAAAAQLDWVLRSVGPDGTPMPLGYTEELYPGGSHHAYDPTNGTVSLGQIYRTNMGQH